MNMSLDVIVDLIQVVFAVAEVGLLVLILRGLPGKKP